MDLLTLNQANIGFQRGQKCVFKAKQVLSGVVVMVFSDLSCSQSLSGDTSDDSMTFF